MSLGFPGIGGSGNPSTVTSLAVGGGGTITSIRFGTSGAMTSGTVTVADTGATAASRYFFTTHTLGTVTLPVAYRASTITPGTSFIISSGNITDTSTVDWFAIN